MVGVSASYRHRKAPADDVAKNVVQDEIRRVAFVCTKLTMALDISESLFLPSFLEWTGIGSTATGPMKEGLESLKGLVQIETSTFGNNSGGVRPDGTVVIWGLNNLSDQQHRSQEGPAETIF